MDLTRTKRMFEGGLGAEDLGAAYERHSYSLLGFFMRRVFDAEAALDLTAETFAQAFLSRRRFRGSTDAELEAWLYAIGRAQLDRYVRRGRAERRAVRRLGIQLPRLSEDDYARIEELASLGELRETVAAALEDLSSRQRTALQLRVVEELPYTEVALRLGVSEPTARARVSRALRALAVAVEAHQPAEEATS